MRHARDLLDAFGRELLYRLSYVLETGRSLLDERLVVEVVVDDVAGDAVNPDGVVPRFHLTVLVCVLGYLYLPWVEDQQVRAVADVLLDSGRQHGVSLRGVRARKQDTVGQFEVRGAD